MNRRDRIQIYHLVGCLIFATTAFVGCAVRADPESDSRVRVALALAAAASHHVSAELPPDDPYLAAFRVAQRDRLPLIVFVGYIESREFKRAVMVRVPSFPGVNGNGIVIGTWHGTGFVRTDLRGSATDAEISAVIYPPQPTATNAQAIANYLALPRNFGRCECGTTGQGCHCKPASDCGRQPCSIHSPLLNPNLVAPVPQQYFTLPQAENCPPGKS